MQIGAQLFHRQVALGVVLADILLGRLHRVARRIRLAAADQGVEAQAALGAPVLQLRQCGKLRLLHGEGKIGAENLLHPYAGAAGHLQKMGHQLHEEQVVLPGGGVGLPDLSRQRGSRLPNLLLVPQLDRRGQRPLVRLLKGEDGAAVRLQVADVDDLSPAHHGAVFQCRPASAAERAIPDSSRQGAPTPTVSVSPR